MKCEGPVTEARLDRFALAGGGEAFLGELADRVEQPVAGKLRVLDDGERLVDDPEKERDDVAGLDRAARADLDRRVE